MHKRRKRYEISSCTPNNNKSFTIRMSEDVMDPAEDLFAFDYYIIRVPAKWTPKWRRTPRELVQRSSSSPRVRKHDLDFFLYDCNLPSATWARSSMHSQCSQALLVTGTLRKFVHTSARVVFLIVYASDCVAVGSTRACKTHVQIFKKLKKRLP